MSIKTWQENLQIWMENSNVSEVEKQQAQALNENQKRLAFSGERIQFGTAGYRAKMGPGNRYFNRFTYQQLATGYAEFIKIKYGTDKPVIVVHDNRLDSEKYALICANVLTEHNLNVYLMENNDVLSTPIVSYLILQMKAAGAINVTASHNPKEDNGFKCYNALGSQLLPDEDELVLNNLPEYVDVLNHTVKNDDSKLHIIDKQLIEQYFQTIKNNLQFTNPDELKNIRVLFSPMHGTSTHYMVPFLKSLGYRPEIFKPQSEIDSNFSNASIINPEETKSFDPAIKYADEHGIELIFMADPDADRLGIAFKKNNKWEFLNGNQAGIIQTYFLLNYYKRDFKPVVVSTFVTNSYIDKIANKYNAKVLRTPTGFKWIADAANKLESDEKLVIGFEEAIGALPSNINREKDSYQVAALLLEILNFYKKDNYDFIDILEKVIYPQFGHWYGQTIYHLIQGEDWKNVAKKAMDTIELFSHKTILSRKIESISKNEFAKTVDFNLEGGSWIKFRISGTEPKFKIYFNLYMQNETFEYDPKITTLLHEESEEIAEFVSQYLGL